MFILANKHDVGLQSQTTLCAKIHFGLNLRKQTFISL